jgi:hypothetical protein
MYPLPTHLARCPVAPFYLRSGFFVFGLTKGKRENRPASICRSTLFPFEKHVQKALEELHAPRDLPHTDAGRLAATVHGSRQMYGRRQCPNFPQRSNPSKATS